ncbi:MAG TPA: hypothetical protein VIT66_03615 [Lysobacter sp.]
MLALLGHSLLEGVERQQVVGYPAPGQLRYYLYIPLGVLAAVVVAWRIARHKPARRLACVVIILTVLAVPLYLLPYTGGM